MNPNDPDPLSALAVQAKTCDEAKVQLADRSAEILLPAVARDRQLKFVESDEILGNYFAVQFEKDVRLYDTAKGMSWRSFLFARYRFSALDFFRRRESSPACHYQDRNRKWQIGAVSTETVISQHRYDHSTTIGDNLAEDRSDDHNQRLDFYDRIKSINNNLTRLIFLLIYTEGLNMREVGEQLGVSESCVSMRHKAGLKKLAKDLSQSP